MSAQQIQLREFTRVSKAERIDREAGILYDLVILGPESANGRRYTEAAMRKAVPLYEGRTSNVNHVQGDAEPSVYDGLGVWRNVRYAEDGKIRGNFHYLKSHALAPSLVEAAERPDLVGIFGFSHDALGSGRRDGSGLDLIESIDHVETVDLVRRPATTQSLTESRERSMTTPIAQPIAKNRPKGATGQKTRKTLRAILTEALAPRVSRKKRLAVQKWLQEMDGDGYMAADEPMDATPGAAGEDLDAEPPAHGEELMQAICDLIDGALQNADSSALDPEYLKKLNEIKAIADSHGSDDDDDDDGEPEPKPTEESKKGKKHAASQQLQEENIRLKRVEAVRGLCDAASFVPTPVQLKSLTPLSDEEAKALIESFKAGPATATTPASDGRQPQTPVSQSPGWKAEPHPGTGGSQRVTEQQHPNPNETDDEARKRRVQQLRTGRI